MARTTRSGTRFSPYTLGEAVVFDVDAEDLLRRRFAELDAMGDVDSEERDEELETDDEVSDGDVVHAMVRLFSILLACVN